MSKIKAVIFDWAGTTVDYGSFAPVQAFIYAFEKFGITPTVEEVRKPMGMLKRDHIRTMMNMDRIHEAWIRIHGAEFTDADVEKVYQESEAGIMKILHDFAEPKPFVLDAVKELREMSIKIGSTTGYTDEMMEIVVPKAKENGYEPDCWFSPNAVNNVGRPYPFMIYKNMETLKVASADEAVKVGDTVADIKEGIAAGVKTVGIIEGSSIMALTQEQYECMSNEEKQEVCDRVRNVYETAGADYVIQNMSELPALVRQICR